MNKSNKTRDERLHTTLVKGYSEKIDKIVKAKGMRSRGDVIEMLVDNFTLTSEQVLKQRELILKENELYGQKIEDNLNRIKELNSNEEVFRIVETLEDKRIHKLLTNLEKMIQRMRGEGSNDDELFARALKFATENTLQSTKCVEVVQSVIKGKNNIFKITLSPVES